MKSILLSVLLLFVSQAEAQEIEQKSFDPFDSIYKVSSKQIGISEPVFKGSDTVAFKKLQAGNTSDPDVEKLLGSSDLSEWINSPRIFMKVVNLTLFSGGKPGHQDLSAYITTKMNQPTSVDSKAGLKIIFEDGKVSDYKNEAKYQAYTKGEYATIVFTVPLNDPLRSKKIKAFKFYTSDLEVIATTNNRTDAVPLNLIRLVVSQKPDF